MLSGEGDLTEAVLMAGDFQIISLLCLCRNIIATSGHHA